MKQQFNVSISFFYTLDKAFISSSCLRSHINDLLTVKFLIQNRVAIDSNCSFSRCARALQVNVWWKPRGKFFQKRFNALNPIYYHKCGVVTQSGKIVFAWFTSKHKFCASKCKHIPDTTEHQVNKKCFATVLIKTLRTNKKLPRLFNAEWPGQTTVRSTIKGIPWNQLMHKSI